MFTSRAEYRLQLREDNADLRLTEQGRALGLISDAQWEAFCRKRDAIDAENARLQHTWVNPRLVPAEEALAVLGQTIEREYTLADLLRRPQVNYQTLSGLTAFGEAVAAAEVAEQVEIQIKYQGYIARQQEEIARRDQLEDVRLPQNIDYALVSGLSKEVQQRLNQHRPETLGQASRIQGMTPAAISLLHVHLKRGLSSTTRSTKN
jgi:tRNA uridine 5-carboxymethylaminomethyl modification enzyme